MISDGNGGYVESNEGFPTEGYEFNSELSGCIDLNGNKVDSTLSYSDGLVSISSNKTSYCYVYFDEIPPVPVAQYLLENPTSGLNTTMEGGLYRFQGTSANNYICFGTSDKLTCTGNTDAYMYRIIGINSSGQLKLIKKEALNSTMKWWNDYTTDTPWPDSTIKSNINGSSFLSNTTYVPSGWSDKIATTSWKYGDNTTDNTTAANLYTTENGWTTTTSAKIGLMYAHDYYYGINGGNNCSSGGAYSTCATSWIYLWNSGNDSSASNATNEWTMTRYGNEGGYYCAWYVHSLGNVHGMSFNGSNAVRPVFFLTSNVEYISGTGTLADPIIIS